jgi:hypothetical protein
MQVAGGFDIYEYDSLELGYATHKANARRPHVSLSSDMVVYISLR